MDEKLEKEWLTRAVATIHSLAGTYGPAYSVSGCGESITVSWSFFSAKWRRPGRFDGESVATALRDILRRKS